MRIARQLSLVLVAVCALSVVAVSSASASPTFLSHPLNLLLASADNINVFTTIASTVECSALKLLPPDKAPALQSLAILVGIQYEECEVPFLGVVTVDPFRYNITAHGLASLDSTAFILGPAGCKITVPAAKNQNLEKLTFDNNNGGILLLAKVTGITSFGEGGLGLCEYAEESKGTYAGNVHIRVEGGVVRWDA